MDTAILDRPKGERTRRAAQASGRAFAAAVAVRPPRLRERPPKMHCQPGTLPPDHEWGHKDGCD